MIRRNFMEKFLKDLENTMRDITKVFNKYGIRFCFIGGAAKNIYGSQRTTEDIDVLINKDDKEKLRNIPIGYLRDITDGRLKRFNWHPDIKLEVIYDGEISGGKSNKGLVYKKPECMTEYKKGLPLLELSHFIQYKICAGTYGASYRQFKDYTDIVSLISEFKLPINFGDNFRDDVKKVYIKLWKSSQDRDEFDN